MTEMRIEIDRLVVPETVEGDELGRMVEQRLSALAAGRQPDPAAAGQAVVADQVAREVWARVQTSWAGPEFGPA